MRNRKRAVPAALGVAVAMVEGFIPSGIGATIAGVLILYSAYLYRTEILSGIGHIVPTVSGRARLLLQPFLLMVMASELRRTLDILQTDHHQHGKLGDVEEVWSAVRIVAKKLDQLGIEHPSIEADDPAWRWWSFVTCLVPHAEAKDMDSARAAMSEMESIADPFPYPWEPPATSDDEGIKS